MEREAAVAYFEAIIDGLKNGSVEFRRGDSHLAMDLPDLLEVEVEASQKGTKAKIAFELSWRTDADAGLSITPAPAS